MYLILKIFIHIAKLLCTIHPLLYVDNFTVNYLLSLPRYFSRYLYLHNIAYIHILQQIRRKKTSLKYVGNKKHQWSIVDLPDCPNRDDDDDRVHFRSSVFSQTGHISTHTTTIILIPTQTLLLFAVFERMGNI